MTDERNGAPPPSDQPPEASPPQGADVGADVGGEGGIWSRKASRRTAMKAAAGAIGLAALGKALAPLREFASATSLEEFLQTHYRELEPAEMERILARLERETKEKYGADVDIRDARAREGEQFAYALNLSVCVGCRKCVEACHVENNHDRRHHNSYIRVLELPNGTLDLAEGDATYDHAVPRDDHFYMPIQCQQCDHPPCVHVCPVEATWKDDDGIVVVDYNWCIGCRYCEAACPYHARRFNWEQPEIAADEVNPDQGYLTNRIRPAGVMEKCHFCAHRTREGRLPACLEACPAGARVFGDLLDPTSELRWVLAEKRVFVLKEELGTRPRFFYFFDT